MLFDSLDFVQLSTQYEYDNNNTGSKETKTLENTITLLPTVISAFISPWLALAMGGITVLYKRTIPSKNEKIHDVTKKKVDVSKPIGELMLSQITDAIGNICQEVDKVVAKIRRDRTDVVEQYKFESDNRTLENMYPQILNGLQYVFMDNFKSGQTNQYIESMIFQLSVYGYHVLKYSQENEGYFAKRVKVGITVPEMYLPAIVKEYEDGTFSVAAEGLLYIPQMI